MDSEEKGFTVIICIIVGVFLLLFGGGVGQSMLEARQQLGCLMFETIELNDTLFDCTRRPQ